MAGPATIMKKELITELWQRFESASGTIEGMECWSARELQLIFGYTSWQNFQQVLERAQESCKNAGTQPEDHFTGIIIMVGLGRQHIFIQRIPVLSIAHEHDISAF
jgi:DNA-damage-inducible protein D